ncbi:MAG TPA: hypothetical protein VGM76_00445 [Lacipirellulaceae bacterium]|jgi:hypothetical protein
MAFISSCAVLALIALHLIAVAAAWGTRVSAGSRAEGFVWLAFVLGMVAVGCCAWYCHQPDSGLGLPSGMTVVAMMLLAVVDFSRTHEPDHSGGQTHLS